MANKTSSRLRWGVERRQEYIEFRLFWEGSINRSDIMKTFNVSVPQASKDLSLYQELAPGNMEYDFKEKRYVTQSTFKMFHLESDPYVYLSRLRLICENPETSQESWIGTPPEAEVAITPWRDISVDTLHVMLKAIRENSSVNVFYQSMSHERPNPLWRKITPHAFGYDGFRWHVRAYCHLQELFRDFLLPRILKIGDLEPSDKLRRRDDLWHEFFNVEIIANPLLTTNQQLIVGKDYGFIDGKGKISVRYAMLFYVLKRLGLLGKPEGEDPLSQHIVAAHPKDVKIALARASAPQRS